MLPIIMVRLAAPPKSRLTQAVLPISKLGLAVRCQLAGWACSATIEQAGPSCAANQQAEPSSAAKEQAGPGCAAN